MSRTRKNIEDTVTRTFDFTTFHCIMLNEDDAVEKVDIMLEKVVIKDGDLSKVEPLLRNHRKIPDGCTFVKVKSWDTVKETYEMPISVFIANATRVEK